MGRNMEPAGADKHAAMPYERAGEETREAKRLTRSEVSCFFTSGALKRALPLTDLMVGNSGDHNSQCNFYSINIGIMI